MYPQKFFSIPESMHNEFHATLVGSVKFVYEKNVAEFIQLLGPQNVQISDVVQQLSITIEDYKEDEKNEFVLVLKELYSMLNGNDAEAVQKEIKILA